MGGCACNRDFSHDIKYSETLEELRLCFEDMIHDMSEIIKVNENPYDSIKSINFDKAHVMLIEILRKKTENQLEDIKPILITYLDCFSKYNFEREYLKEDPTFKNLVNSYLELEHFLLKNKEFASPEVQFLFTIEHHSTLPIFYKKQNRRNSEEKVQAKNSRR